MNAFVSRATPPDAPLIRELLSDTASGFDVDVEMARSYACIWVVRSHPGAPAAGFLLAWDVADEVHLLDLVVRRERRRSGLGRALLSGLLEHARSRGARLVLLEVRQSNEAAQALYASAGFTVTGERPRYYSNGETAVEMRLVLSPC